MGHFNGFIVIVTVKFGAFSAVVASCEETLAPTCSPQPCCTEAPFNGLKALVFAEGESPCKVQCRKQWMRSTEILVHVAVNMQ